MSAMGMMHEGYFVGRKELINWIRQYFDPGFSKIEDLASGVVYCQIIDSIYPGVVPMSKVKMTAKTEVDFIHNFKILQTAFGKKKIDRYIDVDKLTKRSFQYNMEFLQFIKCYWDMHAPDGVAPDAVLHESGGNEQPKPAAPARKAAGGGKPAAGLGPAKRINPPPPAAPPPAARPPPAAPEAQQDLAAEVDELKQSVDNLERERDFYYMKLREVEIMCQQHEGENVPFLQQVLEILYKTDDAEEFVNPEVVEQAQIPA
ncbi:hypothetical protein AB1Y20_022014 [Prymnesium parvum]|uniref:Microtubule-associated protein RP/EB family member 1 n=1 Tax=Prymnesium parvum TaxID=97485 RepID=A0AB34JFM0_PRYPA